MANLSNINNKFLVTTGGNVLIGATADTGFRLHVTGGPTRVDSYLSLGNNGYIRADTANMLRFQSGTADITFYNSSNSVEHVRIKNNTGNVGIGTVSPQTLLNVNSPSGTTYPTLGTASGVIALSINELHGMYLGVDGSSGNGWIQSMREDAGATAYNLILQPSGGNIGIGYTSPGSQLSIYKTAFGGDTAGSGGTLDFGVGSTKYWQFRLDSSSSGDLAIDKTYANVWTTPITIQRSSGNVGIGTAAPAEKLQVAGNIRMFSAGYPLIDMGITTSNYFRLIHDNPNDVFKIGKNGAGTLNITGGGNVGIGTAGPEGKLNIETNAESNVPALGANTTFLKISNTGGAYGAMIGQLGSGNSYIQSQRFDGTATAYNLLLQPNGGNVGIGTVSPSAKLHVQSAGSTDVVFKLDNTNVADTAGAQIQLICDSAGSGDGNGALRHSIRSEFSGAINWEIHSGASHGDLNFSCLDSFAMIINSELDVGIGTTSPRAKLEVAGDITIQNGVYTYVTSGTTAGTTNINFDITVGNEGGQGNVFKIEAGFAHYYAMNYNAVAEWWCTSRGTAVVNTYILNANTTFGGGWSASKPNTTTLRITKSAGTYGGTGKYWVKVTYVPF